MASITAIRLNASSLIETIIALMVIMLTFGIAMAIYIQVMRNSISLSTLRATQLLELYARKAKMDKSYFEESFEENGIQIYKTVAHYQDQDALWLLKLEATDAENRVLAEYKEIVTDEEN